jgi:AAA domain
VHFTLWPSARANEGGHTEIDWPSFLSFVSSPQVVPNIDTIEGWSPVRFAGNRRAKANVEAVSAIVLDDDKTGLPLEQVAALWSAFAGVIHTSRRHSPEAPRYRIVLRCTRDMTVAEHDRVWRHVRDRAVSCGQTLDESTKDASRLWFVPAHLAGAPYAWRELPGAAIDVDAILAQPLPFQLSKNSGQHETQRETPALRSSEAPAYRRQAMAAALGAAWPATGRHAAQLALAGALRGEGFTEAEAVDFLCAVCRAAGDEDRPKREATCRHTFAKPADAALTGWTRLKSHVDPVVVDAARGALARDAAWTERTERRLVEASGLGRVEAPAAPAPGVGPFRFEEGGLNVDLPKIEYLIEPYIGRGEVNMIVAHGNSLKTWLVFSMALDIARGRPWLGQFVIQRGRAAIIDFESGRFEVLRRLKLIGARDEEVGDRLLRTSYPSVSLLDPETWVGLAAQRLDFVVVDSYNAAAPELDENDARSAIMLQHASKYAEHTKGSVTFVHHARKSQGGKEGGDRREAVRGSTALFAACDRIYEMVQPEKRDGVVLSTMRAIKDGAGEATRDVRVALSDADGLVFVKPEMVIETKIGGSKPDETPEERRAFVIEQLKAHSSGVAKKTLVDAMKGKREAKFELLSQLELGGIVVSYREQGREIIMLRPGVEL